MPWRAAALIGLAAQLPEPLLVNALSVAREIWYAGFRARALYRLAAFLTEEERTTALTDALTAAREIINEVSRAEVLSELAPHFTEPRRIDIVEELRSADLAIDLLRDLQRRLAAQCGPGCDSLSCTTHQS